MTFFRIIIASAVMSLFGCSSPTCQFDNLREASALAVAGTNRVEALQ